MISRPQVKVCNEYRGETISDVQRKIAAWTDADLHRMIALLSAGDPILFRFSEARLSVEAAVEAAKQVAGAIAGAVHDDSGSALDVEVGRPSLAKIHSGWTTRDMLPHHDAHHRSFLSPSVIDCPGFDAAYREFSSPELVPTTKTILYSGFVVAETGAADSITTFYDWFGILRRAYRHRFGPATDSRSAVSQWLANNITAAYKQARTLDIEYLSTGSALGLLSPEYAYSVVFAESLFSDDHYRRTPGLLGLTQRCHCMDCDTPGKRAVCNALWEAIGLTFPETLDVHGSAVTTTRNDYLLWCNPRLTHGATRGGYGRKLIPVTVVAKSDYGASYERWLSNIWSAQFH